MSITARKPHIILWLQSKAAEQQGVVTFDGRPLPKHSAIELKCHTVLKLGQTTGKTLFFDPELQLYQNKSGYTICGYYIDTDQSQRRLGFKAYISDILTIQQALELLHLTSDEFGRSCHPIDLDKLISAAQFYRLQRCILTVTAIKIAALILLVTATRPSVNPLSTCQLPSSAAPRRQSPK